MSGMKIFMNPGALYDRRQHHADGSFENSICVKCPNRVTCMGLNRDIPVDLRNKAFCQPCLWCKEPAAPLEGSLRVASENNNGLPRLMHLICERCLDGVTPAEISAQLPDCSTSQLMHEGRWNQLLMLELGPSVSPTSVIAFTVYVEQLLYLASITRNERQESGNSKV